MTTQNSSEIREATVSGGVDLPEELAEDSRVNASGCPTDELGRQLYLLMSLHPDREIGVRKEELETLDTPAKETLLRSAHEALRIEPLRRTNL